MVEYTRFQFRQGTNEEKEDIILQSGEPAYITDYKRVVVGDGQTLGGVSLGSRFLGFVEFDEFSTRVNGIQPGLPGDFIFETSTNLLYILSGTETFLGREAYEIKTNYVEINKTPNPDNINIYNNAGYLSLVPNSLDGRYIAGYALGRGLGRLPNNPSILQVADPGPGLGFENNILRIPEQAVVDEMLFPMPANTIKGRLYSSGKPENYSLDEIANVLKTILSQGGDGFVLGVPVGTIIDYAGQNPPLNYLPCDGTEIPREEYFELFAAIGTTWGSPTTGTFLLPNLNKRVTVGKGDSNIADSDSLGRDIGSYGGKNSSRLNRSQLPKHQHGITFTIPAHSHPITLSIPEFPTAYETGNLLVNSYNNYTLVIQNGLAAAPITVPSGPIDSLTPYRNQARVNILNHKQSLQLRVVKYVKQAYPQAFNNSLELSAKCFRDAGYIIESLAADISNNANHRSIETGSLYFSGFVTAVRQAYNSSVPSLPEDQVFPTIAAISAIGSFITGLNMPVNESGTKIPILSSSIYFNDPQKYTLDGFGIYTSVINNINNVPKSIPPGVTDFTLLTAATAINNFRASLQLNVVTYAKTNFPLALSAQTVAEELALSAKCFRDTGYIVDSILADLSNGANHRSVETGTFYFSGAVLARSSNQNTSVPTLPQEQVLATIMSISSLNTFINALPLPLNNTQRTRIETLIRTVIYPLQTNGQNLPYNPAPAPQPSSLIQASSELLRNKELIQNVVTSYVVQKQYLPNFSPALAKCTRDIGFMIDSIAHYMATGTNAKVIQYAVAYWDGNSTRIPDNSPELFINNQRNNTIDTVRYLNSIVMDIFENFGPSIANDIKTLVKAMVFPLQNNGNTLTYNPPGLPLTPDRQLAARVLQENRASLQSIMRAYVNSLGILNNLPNSTLLKDKCNRDVGYMIDSVTSDLLNGTNAKSVQFALAYWDGNSNRIGGLNGNPNQIIDTVRTVNRLKDESLKIILAEARSQGLSGFSEFTYTTEPSGSFSYIGQTEDGSLFNLDNDPVFVVQPSAVVNKCIKAR